MPDLKTGIISMEWDFDNSVILGYGPTLETRCQACRGKREKLLSKGFAFYCRDLTAEITFIAGSDCRKKIDKNDSDQLGGKNEVSWIRLL